MKSFISITIALIFILSAQSTLKAQQTSISGKITDKLTKEPLVGATIKLGNATTKSGVQGNFSIGLNVEGIKKRKLIISYVGYEEQQIELTDVAVFLYIEMKYNENRLIDVEVSSISPNIVEKAILAIEKNYSQEAVNMFCEQITEDKANVNEYRLYDTAKLKLYVPPFNKGAEEIQAQVLSNKRSVFKSDSSKFLRSSAGLYYLVVACDQVHARKDITDIKKLKDYTITVNGIISHNLRPTYSVDFHKKNGASLDGTLLIDSSTLAFVSIITYPNEKMRKQKASWAGYKDYFRFSRVNYSYQNGLWQFENLVFEQYQRIFDFWAMKTNEYYGAVELSRLYTNTHNVTPIEKEKRIKKTDKTKDINNPDPSL